MNPGSILGAQTSGPPLADGLTPTAAAPPVTSVVPPFNPYTYTTGITTMGQPGLSPFGVGGVPGFVGGEFTTAIPASALLATVAMRRGQPQGPTNDAEVEEFLYDALDLLAGASDVEVRLESGRATLTGTVPHKRLKRDVGEIAWAIPGLNDVQNNVTIAARRRSRGVGGRESEPQQSSSPNTPGRKQS